MAPSLTSEMVRIFRRGARNADAVMLAVATVVGWNEHRQASSGRDLFGNLVAQLGAQHADDALAVASDWLTDPGLSSVDWDMIDDALRFLQRDARGPVDWNAEVATALAPDHRQGSMALSAVLARSMGRVIDLPIQGTVGCLYAPSASVAWVLAEEREVSLFADQDVAIMMALLARAACRPLKVSRRNPLDGSYMPASYIHDTPGRQPPFDRFDHIFTAPLFGARISEGPSKGMPFEAYQLEHLAGRATKSFNTLIPDGVLFRETKFETELRRTLVEQYDVTVMSLPSGMYWPSMGLSTSLVKLEPAGDGRVSVIDGRSMEKTSSGRVQEGLIVPHLEQFRGMRSKDPDRETIVSANKLADSNFALLPERYITSGNLAEVERALDHRQLVALGDLATIERNKAPTQLRGIVEGPPLTAMEIAPMDVADGRVRTPTRQHAFELSEASRVNGVTVRLDDILVSIKGNIGNVGIVGTDAVKAEQLDDPWVISQSLAIVRLQPNPYIQSPAVLNALLTAPWVREKLDSMAGGTTVRSLPISALRKLSIPVPTPEECAEAEAQLDEISTMREQVSIQQKNLADRQRHLWAQLWHVPVGLGDN